MTFTVALAEKDLRVAGDLARGLGVALPQSQVTQAILEQAIEQGFAARDMAAILSYMREQRQ